MARIIEMVARQPKERRRRLLLNLLIGSCSLVAGIGMFSGLASLAHHAGPFELVVAGLFTALITAALTFAVHNAFAARSRVGAVGWAGVWTVCATVSVVMGYGLYFGLLSAEAYSSERIRTQTTAIVAPLGQFAQSYEQLANAADDAAKYSKLVEEKEYKDGGTCPGSTRADDGPRRRLRAADAALFQSYSAHFADRQHAIGKAIAEAEKASRNYAPAAHGAAVATIRHAFDEARLTASDPRLRQWEVQLKERIERGRGPMIDPATKGTFICPDGVLEGKLAGANGISLPALPDKFEEIDAPSHGLGVRRGVEIAMFRERFDAKLDGLPFFLGILVDLMLLAFVRAKSRLDESDGDPDESSRNGPAGMLLRMQRSIGRSSTLGVLGTRLDGILDQPGWAWVALLQKWSSRTAKHLHLAVPADNSAHQDARRLRIIASLLADAPGAKLRMTVPAARIPGRLRDICCAELDASEWIEIYRFPASLISQLERDWLRQAMGDGPAGGGGIARPYSPRAA
jgi:hypothetical protein